jgi:beta-lactamase superfamily II metal-dependent hydrolase
MQILRSIFIGATLLLFCLQMSPAKIVVPLTIYCIDVEGGQATLFVTSSGESLLIDTGWDGFNGRDADRIVAAAKDAHLAKIDYVLITHYHADHVGGVTQLAAKFPIGSFIDHGELRETNNENAKVGWSAYQKLLASGKYKHIVAKPGDVLPIRDAKFTIVTSDGKLLEKPLPGAGEANPFCQEGKLPPEDHSENQFSQGLVMEFGKFRLLDLGDIPFVEEVALTCPVNKIGKIDFFIATHHGLFFSNSPALVHGTAPRVALMENGAKKGGSPAAWDTIHGSPGLEALYQLHWSEEGGAAHNSPPDLLANLDGPDAGNYFKITAVPDGSFEARNSRTGKTVSYPKLASIPAPNIR